MTAAPIYHLAPAGYFYAQLPGQPYRSPTLAQEGFIHCTAGVDLLLQVANAYFKDLNDDLLALRIDPRRLTAPLKFEAPAPPPGVEPAAYSGQSILFPHLYGPLNRSAIIDVINLRRAADGRWQWPG